MHDFDPPGPGPDADERARRRDERERDREARARAREARRTARARRKEHVLHTRISDPLAEDIRRLAEELRVPVSNLVRNVLEEAFSVASQVGEDVGELLDDVLDRAGRASEHLERRRRRREGARTDEAFEEEAGEAEPAAASPSAAADVEALARAFPEVVAWQPVVLNAPGRCARTGRLLATGSRAWLGVGAHGPTPRLLAEDVLPG
jgi:hypothetical protein